MVSVIDTVHNRVLGTMPVGDAPGSAGALPDGSAVYVPNNADGTVSVIDTRRNTVIETITVGAGPGCHWCCARAQRYVPNDVDSAVTVIGRH